MLKQRVITALVLALLAILVLFQSTSMVWQWVVLGVGVIAAWEWAGFAKLNLLWQKLGFSVLVTSVSFIALQAISVHLLLGLTLLECLLLILVVFRYQKSKGVNGPESTLFILATGLLSIVLFVTALVQFRMEFSPQIILLSLMVIWAIDTGAYLSGRRFGKNKLANYVSPGKTWEGVWGGGVLAFSVGLACVMLIQVEFVFSAVLFAVSLALIALFSVFGDLFESVLKRQAGLKDSGNILPGHGGVLDRVDSLLIAVPMLYLLWHFGSLA